MVRGIFVLFTPGRNIHLGWFSHMWSPCWFTTRKMLVHVHIWTFLCISNQLFSFKATNDWKTIVLAQWMTVRWIGCPNRFTLQQQSVHMFFCPPYVVSVIWSQNVLDPINTWILCCLLVKGSPESGVNTRSLWVRVHVEVTTLMPKYNRSCSRKMKVSTVWGIRRIPAGTRPWGAKNTWSLQE